MSNADKGDEGTKAGRQRAWKGMQTDNTNRLKIHSRVAQKGGQLKIVIERQSVSQIEANCVEEQERGRVCALF